ncbi:hypothetical protein [Dactylosporangium sp. NPDC048998]|uniref:hypothetical protein n=1 Tax=Dactylosporangium sp. NPDC048998 TaxID=3363976 RepID=UPI00371E920B
MNDRLDERLAGACEPQSSSIAEPLAESAADIARMGRRAARRRTTRVWIAVAASVPMVVIGVAVGAGKAPMTCGVERLALPSGSAPSLVTAMDPTGRYIVGRTTHASSTSRLDLLIWDNGELHQAELPGERQVPTDVNADGVVVGTTDIQSASGPIDMHAWVYGDRTATLLPGTGSTEARAISDGGVVVGTDDRRPVLWRSTTDAPSTLPLPEGAWEGVATAITADGETILGTLHPPQTGLNRPYVWLADGTLRELPLPVVNGTTALSAYPVAIAGDWVAGTAGDDGVPVRWNLRTGEVQAFPRFRTAGLKISADGWILARDRHSHATLLLSQQATLTLPSLRDRGSFPDVPKVITQDGLHVAGEASAAGSGTLPVVWHCR